MWTKVVLCACAVLGWAHLGQAMGSKPKPIDEGARALEYIKTNQPSYLMNIFHLTSAQLSTLRVKQLLSTGSNKTSILIVNPANNQESAVQVDYSTGRLTMLVQTQTVLLDGRLSVAQIREALRGSSFASDLSDATIKEAVGYSNNIYKTDAQQAYTLCVSKGLLPAGMNFSVLFMASSDMGVEPKMINAWCRYDENLITVNRLQFEAISASERLKYLAVTIAHEGTHLSVHRNRPTIFRLEEEALATQSSYQAALALLGAGDRHTQLHEKASKLFNAVVKDQAKVCAMFDVPSGDFRYLYYRGITPASALTLYDTRNNKEVQVALNPYGDLYQYTATVRRAATTTQVADGTQSTTTRRTVAAAAVSLGGAETSVPAKRSAAPQVKVQTVRPGVMRIQVGQSELFEWSRGRLTSLDPKTERPLGSTQPARMSGTPGGELRLQVATHSLGDLELTLNGEGELKQAVPVTPNEECVQGEPEQETVTIDGRKAEPKLRAVPLP